MGFLSVLAFIVQSGWAGVLEDFNAATQAYRRHEYDEAIALYTKVIESGGVTRKGLAKTFQNRGDAWQGKGNHDKAIADYTKAMDLDPTDDKAFLRRGELSLKP